MSSLPKLGLALAAAAALAPAPARADVPSPQNSTVDSMLIYCPAGDVTFRAVIRRYSGLPAPGSTVHLYPDSCSGIGFCPRTGEEPYNVGPIGPYAMTDIDGRVAFPLRAGGVCPGGSLRVYADGVLMRTLVRIGSPDQNGDMAVDAADLAAITARTGQSFLAADFDGDGVVTQSDVAFASSHQGHVCPAATPARSGTWGRLKLLYR